MPDPATLIKLPFFSTLKFLPGYWPDLNSLLGDVFFFVIMTMILAYVFIAVGLILKYAVQLFHDFRNLSDNEIPKPAVTLWTIFILILPVFFDAGPVWYIIWWFIIFWGYENRAERRLGIFMVCMVLMSGWIAHVGGGLMAYTKTQVNKEIFCIERGVESVDDVFSITSWVQNHTADAEPMNAQALLEIKRGNYAAAVTLLTHALDIEPNNARYYNHFGIALAGMQKYKEAINAFNNASTLEPDDIVYLYNLSRVYVANLSLADADQIMERASRIDPTSASTFLSHQAKDAKMPFVIEPAPAIKLLARQMRPSEDLGATADALWHTVLGIFERDKALWVGIGLIIALLLLGHIPDDKFTKLCSRCGNSFYVGTSSKSGYPMCLQCNWLEAKAKKQPTPVMQNKLEEIRQYRGDTRLRTSKLELILPGMGSLIANRTGRAVTWIFIMSACIIMIVTGGTFMHSFGPSGVNAAPFVRVMGVIIAAILYWRAYKSPPVHVGN